MLNGLDLFSGIGGLTLALQDWVRPIAYCEQDRYAQTVLLSRMQDGLLPLAPIWDDVTTLQGANLPADPDIIYGGFPCQDISTAGSGAGLAGERSGLFFEVARLVSEIRPAFVFLENVPAIRTRGADVVTGRLAELGYDCRWCVLSAAQVGAPHLRERWWLLGYANDQRQPASAVNAEVAELSKPLGHDSQSGRWAQVRSIRGRSNADTFGDSWWKTEPDVGRVAHGIPHRVDRIKCLGNAVVPLQAREAFKTLAGITEWGRELI